MSKRVRRHREVLCTAVLIVIAVVLFFTLGGLYGWIFTLGAIYGTLSRTWVT